MADFKQPMSEWQGGFAPVQRAVPIKDNSTEEMIAKAGMSLLEGMGKGYATGVGQGIIGEDTTAVEAEEAVDAFKAATNETVGMSNAEIEDMKTAALKKYATNDKKMQAMVNAGVITTLEANARRHAMLQENLSNPILAMFKDDFMEAATPFTGGSGTLAQQYFGAYLPTEQERMQYEADERIAVARAKAETELVSIIDMTGLPRDAAKQIQDQQRQDAAAYDTAKQNNELRKWGSPQTFSVLMKDINATAMSTNGLIYGVMKKGIDITPEVEVQLKEAINQSFNTSESKIMEASEFMTPEDTTKALAQLKKSRDFQLECLTDKTPREFLKAETDTIVAGTEYNQARQVQTLNSFAPELYALKAVGGPEAVKFFIDMGSGSYSAKFLANASPTMRNLAEGADFIANNNRMIGRVLRDQPLSTQAEKFSFVAGTTQRTGMKNMAKVEGAQERFREAWGEKEFSLALLVNNPNYIMELTDPKTAEAAYGAVLGRQETIRGIQFARKRGVPTQISVEKVETTRNPNSPLNNITYRVKSASGPELDKDVQKEIVQLYKMLQAPHLLKLTGKPTVDEALNAFINGDLK